MIFPDGRAVGGFDTHHFYPEIVNPNDGTPLNDGEQGELLFTTLTKEALPVIRYRTRDLTRLLPGTARTMRRMDRISGRSDDMLIIRGVNVFPSQLEEEIVKFEHLSPHYQLEVNRRGHLDSLSVKVELKERRGMLPQLTIMTSVEIPTIDLMR